MNISWLDPKNLLLTLADHDLNHRTKIANKLLIALIFLMVCVILGSLSYHFLTQVKLFQNKIEALRSIDIPPNKSQFFKRVNLKQIEQKKLFGTLAPQTRQKVEPSVVVEKPKYTLVATFVNPKSKYAIIENGATKVQDAFEEGETVFDQATLQKISAGRAVIRWKDGTEDTLVLDEAATDDDRANAEPVGTVKRIALSRTTLDELMSDISVLATQARAIPFFQDGKPVGLRLFGLTPGGIYQFLGLENGDIIKSVEGTSVMNPGDLSNLVKQLKEKSRITVVIERNRENVELVYDIS
ncbi:MAG: hypothetical protein NZO16_02385 [Deltaproteobacteria bacterium]|nr:hypothetical protein [Deltaproteobacteria bacterium]